MKQANKRITRDKNSRQAIIAAALELFSANGYASTSVDNIAAAAKMSKGLIYYYFKSKEEILRDAFVSLLSETGMLYKNAGDLPPRKFLKNMVENAFRLIAEQTNLYRLILSLTIQPEAVTGLKAEMEAMRKTEITDLVDVFKALGYKQPETEAYLLIALFDGVGLAYLAMQDYPVNDIRHAIMEKYQLS